MSKLLTKVRPMLRSDLPEVVAIEQETFGYWDREDFEACAIDRDILVFVAVCEDGSHVGRGRVVGLLVLEVTKYSLQVLNMAATTKEARILLIDRANNRAMRHRRELIWREE